MSNLYADVLRRLDDPGIGDRAVQLLRSSKPRAQKAAVEILIDKPSAAALDRLWELRCALEGDDERFFLRMQVDEALATCVRLDPEWLQRAIERADPGREPFTALIFLLGQLGEVEAGGRIWAEVRDTVFRKAPDSDKAKRALANAVETFGDHEARSRVSDWVTAADDLAAPAALRALELLSPEEALDALEKAPIDTSLVFGRSWWLPQFLAFQYERTSEILYRKIESHEKPWLAAGVYDHRENLVTAQLLDLLLDVTGRLLETALAEPRPENRDPLYRPFHFLADVSRLDLLARFEARRGTRFEEALTDYLIRQGPSDEGWRRWNVEYGISVLQRIGGDGFTRLVNEQLRTARTRLGIREALLLAVRGPNAETRELVAAIAHDPARGGQTEDGFPLVQYETAKALATLGEWREVAQAVLRLGLNAPKSLPDYLAGHVYNDEELAGVLGDLRSGAPSSGAILMTGMSGRKELAEEIRAIYGHSERDSERSLACLLALEALEDQEATSIFIENLGSPRSGWAAARALLGSVRSSLGDAALLARLRDLRQAKRDDPQLLAMNLLIRSETREQAATILWKEYDRSDIHFLAADTIRYLGASGLPGVSEFLLSTALSDQQSGWHADRSAAIEGLADLDRTAAYEAAKVLLRSADEDRLLAPERLLAIDAAATVGLFRETLATSEDFLLIAAIGESLDRYGATEPMRVWLDDPDHRVREGACFALEAIQWTEELASMALPRFRDRNWDVRVAARTAYEALHLSRETARLAEAVAQEAVLRRRWILADATLTIGYPGVVAGHGAHSWFGRMCDGQPYALRRHALDKLEEKRKKLISELGKRERD